MKRLLSLLSIFFLAAAAHSGLAAEPRYDADEREWIDDESDSLSEAIYEAKAAPEVPEVPLLDLNWKKSNALEDVLSRNLDKLLVGSGIHPDRFRSSVVVLFDEVVEKREERKPASQEPQPDKSEKTGLNAPETLDFPELQSNPTDLSTLFNRFRSSAEKDDALFDFTAKSESRKDEAPVSTLPKHAVTLVSMGVTVDSSVGEERAKEIEENIRKAYAPAFRDRLAVQVRSADLIGPVEPAFFERLKEFENLAWLALILSGIILFSILWKLIPSIRSPLRFSLERKNFNTDKREISERKEGSQEKEKDDVQDDSSAAKNRPPFGAEAGEFALPRVLEDGEDNDKRSLADRIIQIEQQIISIVQQHPNLSRILIQDHVSRMDAENDANEAQGQGDRSMLSLSVLLETLAKYRIPAERFSVKPSILRKFQSMRNQLAGLDPEERLKMLEESNWMLVSFSFLSDGEGSFPRFHFLEALTDSQIAAILEREEPSAQIAVLFGLNERRTSSIMTLMPHERRQRLFELMCEGRIPPESSMNALVERMREKGSAMAKIEGIPVTKKEGIERIAQFVTELDFQSEFRSIQALFANAPEMRRMLKGETFFVSLLPEAKTDFLKMAFSDRNSEWLREAIAPFGEAFKERIAATLPPFQRKIVETTSLEGVSSAASMKTLEELQKSIRQKIANREISLDEIFDLQESVEAQGGMNAQQAA